MAVLSVTLYYSGRQPLSYYADRSHQAQFYQPESINRALLWTERHPVFFSRTAEYKIEVKFVVQDSTSALTKKNREAAIYQTQRP